MNFLIVLAQEGPGTVPDWVQGPALAAVLGFLAGLVPQVVAFWRVRKQESREDAKVSSSDRQQLIRDLRTEREEIRVEMRALRKEHEECLQKAAAQQAQIEALKQDIIELQKIVAEMSTKAHQQPGPHPHKT